MKNLIFLLIPLLFLSSCTIDWNDEKDKKITELQKQIQDDTFKKKQECTKYKGDMLKEAMDFHAEWMNRTGDPYDLKIEEIFYSKNYSSCIYELSVYKYTGIDNNDGLGGKILLNKYLYDYFSKKEILSTADTGSKEFQEEGFQSKINELKGE